jgi:hypothetical protein
LQELLGKSELPARRIKARLSLVRFERSRGFPQNSTPSTDLSPVDDLWNSDQPGDWSVNLDWPYFGRAGCSGGFAQHSSEPALAGIEPPWPQNSLPSISAVDLCTYPPFAKRVEGHPSGSDSSTV